VTPFDAEGMRSRRQAWYAFVRSRLGEMFAEDGSYLPGTEPDGRIAYWIQPALLADAATRDWSRRIYGKGAGWDRFDIFMTSQVATHLARHRDELGRELVARSLAHLDAFALREQGRQPSAAVYDYRFHGYNDNMPAMATRTLLLAADALGRADLREAGRFHLSTLAMHLERRGLLSEHTSPTYTPIALCALLDIAECCQDADDRRLAQSCADRVLLDLIAHWHPGTGALGGASMRSYTVDCTQTLSNWNAWWWQVSGDPLAIDPRTALSDPAFPAPMHHARNLAFNLAQFSELMSCSYTGVGAGVRAYAARSRDPVHTVTATSDWSASGAWGGQGCLTRAHHRPGWFLASASGSVGGGAAGQQLVLHAGWRTCEPAVDWQDRAVLWPRLIADAPDQGQDATLGASPHAGAYAGTDLAAFRAESDHVHDWAWYSTAQAGGSALLVGSPGPDLDGRTVATLRFGLLLRFGRTPPEEVWQGGERCVTWVGAADDSWTCLRWGGTFVGLRLLGMAQGRRLAPRRALRHGYHRLELPLWEDAPRTVSVDDRRLCDFAALVEMGDAEGGSFSDFRAVVAATRCEFNQGFHREARFIARGGELHLNDAPLRGTQRFIAVDGRVEETPRFRATGLDERLLDLVPGGRPRLPSLLLHGHAQTPFYSHQKSHVIADERA
jgi:hypothetical protein